MTTTDIKHTITALLAAGEVTQSEIARGISMSAGTVSLWIRGDYRGDSAEVERKVADWLANRTGNIRLEVKDAFETAVTRALSAELEITLATGHLRVIHGDAGAGKTVGIAMFAAKHPTTIAISLAQWSRNSGGIEREIAAHFGRSWQGRGSRGDYIASALKDSRRLLIVDNAQRLTAASMDWLCDLHDRTGIGIALVGNVEVLAIAARVPQRRTRIAAVAEVGFRDADDRSRDKELAAACASAAVRHAIAICPAMRDCAEALAAVRKVARETRSLRAVRQRADYARVLCDSAAFRGKPAIAFASAHAASLDRFALVDEPAPPELAA